MHYSANLPNNAFQRISSFFSTQKYLSDRILDLESRLLYLDTDLEKMASLIEENKPKRSLIRRRYGLKMGRNMIQVNSRDSIGGSSSTATATMPTCTLEVRVRVLRMVRPGGRTGRSWSGGGAGERGWGWGDGCER